MKPLEAINMWNLVCSEPIGVDSDGEEVTKISSFGYVAIGAGLPISLSTFPNSHAEEQISEVADFLEMWSETLRKRVVEIKERG